MAQKVLTTDNEVATNLQTDIISNLTVPVHVFLPTIGDSAGQAAVGTVFYVRSSNTGSIGVLNVLGQDIGLVPAFGTKQFAAKDAGPQAWSEVDSSNPPGDITLNGVSVGGGTGQFPVYNARLGANALASVDGGYGNVAIGASALEACTDGFDNIGIGESALLGVTTGDTNVGIGQGAGAGITTGQRNTLLGGTAGDVLTTGSGNIVIGEAADPSGATAAHEIVIGNTAVQAANVTNSVDATVAKKIRVRIGNAFYYLLADVDNS